MIAGILDFIAGGALRLLLLVIGLLPTVSLDDLPLKLPEAVRGALGVLNWFVPIGDLVSITAWWAGVLLVVNAALLVSRLLDMARK